MLLRESRSHIGRLKMAGEAAGGSPARTVGIILPFCVPCLLLFLFAGLQAVHLGVAGTRVTHTRLT